MDDITVSVDVSYNSGSVTTTTTAAAVTATLAPYTVKTHSDHVRVFDLHTYAFAFDVLGLCVK
jgi:hypothetical protein